MRNTGSSTTAMFLAVLGMATLAISIVSPGPNSIAAAADGSAPSMLSLDGLFQVTWTVRTTGSRSTRQSVGDIRSIRIQKRSIVLLKSDGGGYLIPTDSLVDFAWAPLDSNSLKTKGVVDSGDQERIQLHDLHRVYPPSIDAEDAGAAAIEQYDTDGDGAISGTELDAVPGIKVAETLPKYDKDGDGKVTADEIAARIIEWQDSKIAIAQPFLCSVYLDGRPLPGATVKLVPEAFLGPAVKGAIGVSNDQGVVNAGIPREDRAADLKSINGMQLGLYKVEITHPDIQIPARFNTATTLGEEYAHDRRIMSSDDIRFMIRSQ